MGKITGLESMQEVPAKVLLLYEAVGQLIEENVDIKDIRVSNITDKAGIGKGTAYEYFDTKDEILACAIIYYMRKAVEEIDTVLSLQNSFAEQVAFLLEEVENKSAKQQCMLRFVHMMTDTSVFSRLVQKKMQTKDARQYLPIGIFVNMVERARKRGEVRTNLPTDYMIYTLFSKILSYVMCVAEDSIAGMKGEQIRHLVYRSVLEELCEEKCKFG